MATQNEIKKALLDAAGNPESGVIVEVVDDLAKAVVRLINPEVKEPVVSFDKRETTTIAPTEKR